MNSEKVKIYRSILSKTRSITPGIPPKALIASVYGFMGIPPEEIKDITRSQQKRAQRPDATERKILPIVSFFIINIIRIAPATVSRTNRRFITSPFNIMIVPCKKCVTASRIR